MSGACRDFRQAAAQGADLRPFADHVAGCEDCADWEKALQHPQLGRLIQLERLVAPRELGGRVVAALHAGYRQDRAADEVQRLGRLQAPDELERRLRAGSPSRYPRTAPQELDRRVGQLLQAQSRQEQSWRRGLHAAAGLLVLALGLWFLPSKGSSAPRERQAYSFQVFEMEDSELDSWEPYMRGLVSGMTGGLSDAH